MNNNIITKQEFCKIIEHLKIMSDYECQIYETSRKLTKKLDSTFYESFLDPTPAISFQEPMVVFLLEKMFSDTGDIQYFIYELDYGRKYSDGCVVDTVGGKDIIIDLSSAEKLYDYLISRME